jgi:hypothetical protein
VPRAVTGRRWSAVMVLSHMMMGQVGTTIACCLVSCLHLRFAGQSSSEILSRQSSQWLKNLKIIVSS